MIEEKLKIEDMIYEIRGKQVMLDSDLAKLYECTNGTKDINKAVNRNIERFPDDFYFQLTKEEYQHILRSQNGTLELKQGKYSKYIPHVFTEQGVAMLSGILKTKKAINISVDIMRAFIIMKRFISTNLIEQKYYNDMVVKHDFEIKLLRESFDEFNKNVKNSELFYEGQIYDAYSLMIDIFNTSENHIVIIDNYIDKSLLDILAKTSKHILIITNKYKNEDYDKYKKQYGNIQIKINNKIHDRFIIIDNKTLYHCGASFKDLGKKCFAINKIENKEWLQKILKYLI